MKIINREISWLSFNDRVLQEAADVRVPLLERMKFLGIYSSNMDEFFRVRVATLKRMLKLDEAELRTIGVKPKKILQQIQDRVLELRKKFDNIYKELITELAGANIFLVNETQLTEAQGAFVRNYFHKTVRPTLVPIMLDSASVFPMLKDNNIYLAILLTKKLKSTKRRKYALIELPTDIIPRFLVLPPEGENNYVIILDDVIRYCLDEIFAIFNFDQIEAYTIKLTRDARLDLEDDVAENLLQKISKGLKQRKRGEPVRFIYDECMPLELHRFLFNMLKLRKSDNLLPGSRYHNFKDFMNFPRIGREDLRYKSFNNIVHPILEKSANMFELIKKKDVLLIFPYHSFDYVIDFLREAAIDPKVDSIKITLYRVAENSNVVNTLINAVKNGKQVTVVVELQARFDEEANIFWANKLREEGAKVIFGSPGLKIHSKLCLISRKERNTIKQYAFIGSGNFNENTSRIYSDIALLTSKNAISNEVAKVFSMLQNSFKIETFQHLLVAPYYMRSSYIQLINKEIEEAKAGRQAWMILKMNSLMDVEMIDKLYEASKAGVKIRLIIRGICGLKPGINGLSENIEAISIVDRYLEHARIMVFCNAGKKKIYFGSADWMTRNLDHRVEVNCPIEDETIKKDIFTFLCIQWSDNMKARILDKGQNNYYKSLPKEVHIRSQYEMYEWMEGNKSNAYYNALMPPLDKNNLKKPTVKTTTKRKES